MPPYRKQQHLLWRNRWKATTPQQFATPWKNAAVACLGPEFRNNNMGVRGSQLYARAQEEQSPALCMTGARAPSVLPGSLNTPQGQSLATLHCWDTTVWSHPLCTGNPMPGKRDVPQIRKQTLLLIAKDSQRNNCWANDKWFASEIWLPTLA